ncbi:hypothetical protein [Coleofasciculus sp. E1-EBD-02]|uniref:hypothetical protein n=1 Tax=Coleofasciculus sp. E1-EBD-02 TaxID=3068481 RepID=UPI0032FA7466
MDDSGNYSLVMRYYLILLLTFLLVLIANSVQAQVVIVTDEMSKVQVVSLHLLLITQGMAEAVILPVGISSSVKILRHVVLGNV